MSHSQPLHSTALMAACLLTPSGCSVGWTDARGTSSVPPDQVQDAAPEAARESAGRLEDTSPVDPPEYGSYTSSDIQDYDDEPIDDDAEGTHAQAEAQVTEAVSAPEQVSVIANEPSTDQAIKVSAGARDVTITAQSLVVVVKGEIESLTINGFDNTAWVGASNKITSGASGGDGQNYVFWHSRSPQTRVGLQDLNIISKDVHAPAARSCRFFSRYPTGYRAGTGLPGSTGQCNKPLTARRSRKAGSSYPPEPSAVDTTGGVDGSGPEQTLKLRKRGCRRFSGLRISSGTDPSSSPIS